VDLCVEEWLMEGYIDIDGRAPRVKRRDASIPEPSKPFRAVRADEIDESLLDPSLDIDESRQREILEVERRLGCDSFTVLDVGRDIEPKQLKRAYYQLSKRFHPDRHFRRNLGDYAERLDAVFKAINEAYEELSDPALRKQLEATLAEAQGRPRIETFSDPGDPKAESARTRKPLSPAQRLRQRMPFRVPEGVKDEKTARGDELFKAAEQADRMGRPIEAAASLRLAIAFDPFNREYKRALGKLQARIARDRLEELLAAGAGGVADFERNEARRLVQEMVLYRPKDAEVTSLAARVYIELGDADRADEFVDRLAAASPNDGAHHRLRALVHELRGNKGHALKELDKALELDSQDAEARELILRLRGGRRR